MNLLEGHIVAHHPMAYVNDRLGGVLVYGAFEEDGPGTWEAHRLDEESKARREGDQSTCRMPVGVGGPCSSDEAGERVTTDPVERRGARVGSNFRREP